MFQADWYVNPVNDSWIVFEWTLVNPKSSLAIVHSSRNITCYYGIKTLILTFENKNIYTFPIIKGAYKEKDILFIV